MKTLIYARFSSLLQNSRSIEDQITICRERCEREGWEIVDVYTDYAISGAAGITDSQRPGLAAMLARIERGGIDQVLAESTDRIARHEGDSFAIRERLAFADVRLFTLFDGEINHLTGTLKGMMDANFRKELGAKIKRGQRGTVAQGRSPAGSPTPTAWPTGSTPAGVPSGGCARSIPIRQRSCAASLRNMPTGSARRGSPSG